AECRTVVKGMGFEVVKDQPPVATQLKQVRGFAAARKARYQENTYGHIWLTGILFTFMTWSVRATTEGVHAPSPSSCN
ncbi:MAG: hypothetical protein ABSD51_11885, partial [Candidatus Binatus sp.]